MHLAGIRRDRHLSFLALAEDDSVAIDALNEAEPSAHRQAIAQALGKILDEKRTCCGGRAIFKFSQTEQCYRKEFCRSDCENLAQA